MKPLIKMHNRFCARTISTNVIFFSHVIKLGYEASNNIFFLLLSFVSPSQKTSFLKYFIAQNCSFFVSTLFEMFRQMSNYQGNFRHQLFTSQKSINFFEKYKITTILACDCSKSDCHQS